MRLDSDRPAHPSPDTAPRSSTHPHRATRARSEENDPKWRGTCSVSNQSIYAIMHYGAALEPWPRQLDRKLDRNSTGTRQLDAQAHGASLDKPRAQARQELSTGARHRAGSTGKASTAPRRSLDSSTARQPGLKAARVRLGRRGRSATAADIGAMCAELTRTHVNTLIESLIRPSAPNTIGNSTLALQALEPATLVTRWVSHSCMTQGFEPIVI